MTYITRSTHRGVHRALALVAVCALFALTACQSLPRPEPYETKRDKTAKGAGIGAAAGAAGAILAGEREADEILVGAAIGAAVGGGIGYYMDRQEEKLARIPGTTVERVSEDVLLVHFDSDILFDTDSASLDPGARGTLEDVSQVFHEFPKTAIVVQGHTDSRGTEEHNEQLSERRARSVEAYLVGRGVDGGRITSVGYGEQFPVADNDSDWGRQQNRRVDLLLKGKAR
jgi:outer membrane protein OmpA-like peptidoglycan-associated protein